MSESKWDLSRLNSSARSALKRSAGTMPGEDVVYIVYYIPKTEDAAPAAGTPFGLGGCPANVGDCME